MSLNIKLKFFEYCFFDSHITCTTSTCHPYILQVEEPAPTKRLVTLQRDSIHGFGFIAGSEGPVVVRSVTEGNIGMEDVILNIEKTKKKK